MIKKMSAVFILAGLLLVAVLSRPAKVRLDAQEPELLKTNPLAEVGDVGDGEIGRQSAATGYNSYGSGDFFLPPYLSDNERMGFNKTSSHDTTVLNAGWYHNWSVGANPPHPGGVEYAQTIHFSIDKKSVGSCKSATQHSQVTAGLTGTTLLNYVQANPGALWVIGNEPDSYYNGSPIHPHLYAELYHYFYTAIKTADPTAKIAIGSIVQPSPLRMEYLDKVLTHYQNIYTESLQTDLWGIHLYRLNEGPCSLSWGAAVPPVSSSNYGWNVNFSVSDILSLSKIEQSIRDFRQWMYDRGYGNVPLIIAEYGVLPPPSYSGFSDAVAARFLEDSFDMLLTAADPVTGLEADGGRLVQMWAWFSTDHVPPPGWMKYGGDLFTGGGDLTVIGQRFIEQANAHFTPYIDLQPIPPTLTLSTTNALTVGAYIQNRGNTTATDVLVLVTLIDASSGVAQSQITASLGQIGPRYAGEPALLEQTWRISPAEVITTTLPYTVNVTIITSDAVSANNTLSYPVNWRPLIDLAISEISFSAGSAFLYQAPLPVTATVTVFNRGGWPSPETTLDLTLYAPGEAPRSLAKGLIVPALPPQSGERFTATFTATQVGTFQLSAELPADIDNAELYTPNNHYTATLLAASDVVYLPFFAITTP